MFALSCACARTTFQLARTAFSYWRTIGIGHECYCLRGRPMRARRNKIRGNIARHTLNWWQQCFINWNRSWLRKEILSTGYCPEGYCPGGYCPGGYCFRTFWKRCIMPSCAFHVYCSNQWNQPMEPATTVPPIPICISKLLIHYRNIWS